MTGARGARCLLLGCLGLATAVSGGYTPPAKYLIVSNARNGTIGYVRLTRSGGCSEVRTLIDKELVHPQGIAVDQKRQLLLIADSELRKVVSYGLTLHEDGALGVDEQTPVAEDVETRWVAVDGPGNVYMTEEQSGQILKITGRQVLDGDTAAKPVFSASSRSADGSSVAVAAPGGIATDNFHVYWTNKVDGQNVGTVVRALDGAPSANVTLRTPMSKVLAKNAPKAYGLCMALDNVFFTDLERNVYAVKSSGGDVVKVSAQLGNPRGCAWDGQNTVYVADRSADGIFALPGPMHSLAETSAKKVCDFEGAFGLAVFSSAQRPAGAFVALHALLIAALAAALVGA